MALQTVAEVVRRDSVADICSCANGGVKEFRGRPS